MRVLAAVLCLMLTACASLRPQSFEGATPRFEPIAWFEGPVHSWGVFESRRGEPVERFGTTSTGVREGEVLVLTQQFLHGDGRREQRVWRLRRVDAHRYVATADDVVGPATGVAYGNAFRWEYTLEATPGNPLTRVRVRHWMYLADDGELLLNRVVITKFGVVVRQATEYFRRGRGDVPTIVGSGPG